MSSAFGGVSELSSGHKDLWGLFKSSISTDHKNILCGGVFKSRHETCLLWFGFRLWEPILNIFLLKCKNLKTISEGLYKRTIAALFREIKDVCIGLVGCQPRTLQGSSPNVDSYCMLWNGPEPSASQYEVCFVPQKSNKCISLPNSYS